MTVLGCTVATAFIFFASVFVIAQAPFADESTVKTELREAIFRYMFARYNYGPYVKVFCIQPERPQPENFLRRFSGNKIRVVWASDCELDAPMNGIREKKTGDHGMRMTVTSIQWITGSEAEAKVEAFSDGIAANWNTLRIVLKSGRWVVKSDKIDAVS
ncbi:MAG TPA: hypothetical protein VGF20_13335 [Candidatus Acidoferrum sp.]|jgi:hypothetical protein